MIKCIKYILSSNGSPLQMMILSFLHSLHFNWSEHWPIQFFPTSITCNNIQWFTLFTCVQILGLVFARPCTMINLWPPFAWHDFLSKCMKLIKVNAFINWWQNSQKIGVLFVSIEYLIRSFAWLNYLQFVCCSSLKQLMIVFTSVVRNRQLRFNDSLSQNKIV